MVKRKRYPIIIDDQCVGWVTATSEPSEKTVQAIKEIALSALARLEKDKTPNDPRRD